MQPTKRMFTLHKTDVAHAFLEVWDTGDITLHEIYNNRLSPFEIDRVGYHVLMSVRGSDVDKLRELLNELHYETGSRLA